MPIKPEDQIAYLFSIQQQIHESIKFADQKAAVIIVINTGLIGAIYGTNSLHPISALVVIFIIALGVLFSILVISPRQWPRRNVGFTDQSRIVLWESREEEYKSTYVSLEYGELRDDLLMFVLDRSKTDDRKYNFLVLSILTSSIGWIAALLLLAALKIP